MKQAASPLCGEQLGLGRRNNAGRMRPEGQSFPSVGKQRAVIVLVTGVGCCGDVNARLISIVLRRWRSNHVVPRLAGVNQLAVLGTNLMLDEHEVSKARQLRKEAQRRNEHHERTQPRGALSSGWCSHAAHE